ncbi:tRNA (uridine(54)-C5)-methyltransferase TrmA [Suttonella sp. R2A3]|uniref:tRNA (uridine(54)-C5)-methyltransferase TrmA n=1 Tax=Suttonella sp. R2A3 TaxID=2908648 RepID=UPI0038FC086E
MPDYQSQLRKKHHRLRDLLAPFYDGEIEIHESPETHHRLRAEFRIWHDEGQCSYVMTRQGEKAHTDSVIRLDQLPAANQRINALMPELMHAINTSEVLRERLFQVEFLSTLRGDDLITMVYHRKLDECWQAEAEDLQNQLNCAIIGRSRKQKIVLSRDHVSETLTVAGKAYQYRQYEGTFSQPNGVICEAMLDWAYRHNHQPQADLLELYCGNGNFTLPLAQRYRRVLATEISKSGIRALRENITLNQCTNLTVARLSAEEFSQAWRGVREFNRLKQDHIALDDYQFAAVLVDPPRAGIDEDTLNLLSEFPQITYISCNPETLAANLATLSETHTVTDAALFDQFPFTPHIESGVILQRR